MSSHLSFLLQINNLSLLYILFLLSYDIREDHRMPFIYRKQNWPRYERQNDHQTEWATARCQENSGLSLLGLSVIHWRNKWGEGNRWDQGRAMSEGETLIQSHTKSSQVKNHEGIWSITQNDHSYVPGSLSMEGVGPWDHPSLVGIPGLKVDPPYHPGKYWSKYTFITNNLTVNRNIAFGDKPWGHEYLLHERKTSGAQNAETCDQ